MNCLSIHLISEGHAKRCLYLLLCFSTFLLCAFLLCFSGHPYFALCFEIWVTVDKLYMFICNSLITKSTCNQHIVRLSVKVSVKMGCTWHKWPSIVLMCSSRCVSSMEFRNVWCMTMNYEFIHYYLYICCNVYMENNTEKQVLKMLLGFSL